MNGLSREERATAVREHLRAAFGMPDWEKRDALDELILTVLSQNTNDRNRDLAYQGLRAKFNTWEHVRDATPESVIDAIRIAGLANQKGPRIQAILQTITEQQGDLDLSFLSQMQPGDMHAWLTALKGVGPKTASIVMLFSLETPAFPVDTHVYRVSGRIGLRDQATSVEAAHETLASLFPQDSYGEVHLNLIRLGRQICHARKPSCPTCPVADLCLYPQKTA
ncbi:MAG: endonuclease III [Anaerolineae bacterium]|nr:endonuclease III [Anaerolineae bacterium]